MSVSTAVFYLIALITVGSAAMVAFSRNIIYSAFSLLGTFMGVGGILVLILFAVMLTHRITDVEVTNRAAGRIPALIIVGVLVYLLIETVKVTPWVKAKEVVYAPTTATIGDLFLYSYLLPFELASLVLLGAMIGAVVLSRKEIKE